MTDLLIREPVAATETDPAPPRREGRVRFLLRRPGLVVSLLFVALVLLAAFAPQVLAPGDPAVGVPALRLQPPGPAGVFGTDYLGRDVFTRVVHGAALSLQATVIAVAVALVVGGLVGRARRVRPGLARRGAHARASTCCSPCPPLLLSLALITALGYGTVKVAIAVGVASVASFARVMRAETLRVRQSVYVEAARAVGTRWHVTLLRHVLPNAAGPGAGARGAGVRARDPRGLVAVASSATARRHRPRNGARWSPRAATTWPWRGGCAPCRAPRSRPPCSR